MPAGACLTMDTKHTAAFDKACANCRQAVRGSKTPPKNINEYVDLVKSHLMYAVREEVEVLKEQIKELMDRMRQIEFENKILRADATPETLAKLPPALPPLTNPTLQQFMTASSSST